MQRAHPECRRDARPPDGACLNERFTYIAARTHVIAATRPTRRPIIGADRRVYSDEEFALILRRAAELAQPSAAASHASGGLTLDDMKAAASQVGIDPVLVERAARTLTAQPMRKPTVRERIFGGRGRYTGDAEFAIALDESDVARLMSAIRIAVGQPGEGHASALGLTWRSSDDAGGVLTITARTSAEGTSVSAAIDRRVMLGFVTFMTAVGVPMALMFGATVASELASGFEPIGALLGAGAVVTIARAWWSASSRVARHRLSDVMDSITRFLAAPRDATSDDNVKRDAQVE